MGVFVSCLRCEVVHRPVPGDRLVRIVRIKGSPMKSAVFARAGILVGLLALIPVVHADEEKVPLKDVPQVVLDAVKAKFPGAELTGAEKEVEDGTTSYEVALKDKGRKIEVTVTAQGSILETETDVAVGDLPTAVSSAIKAKYPKGTIKEAEAITRIKEGKETRSYEVVVATGGKKSLEIKVSPEGKILKSEDAEDED